MSPPNSPADRYVVVNADDFGISHGVNRGIVEAHERGVVTSASLMVRYGAAREAAEYGRRNLRLSVGLHLDLAEWRYSGGEWRAHYVVADVHNEAAVNAEVEKQLMLFQRLLDRSPTHLDSHQHLHNSEPVRSVMMKLADRLEVPLRNCTPEVIYRGDFYGQSATGEPFPSGISVEQLVRTITSLSPGWSEVACHPGYADDLDSVYSVERAREVQVLCESAVAEAIVGAGVRQRSFHEFCR